MESTSASTLGWAAFMFLISSTPDPPAIEMSTITISGLTLPINCSALGALSASPQTWRSDCWLIKVASHSRTRGWSSTSNTLAFSAIRLGYNAAAGQFASHTRAARDLARDVERRADDAGTVRHGSQAHPG